MNPFSFAPRALVRLLIQVLCFAIGSAAYAESARPTAKPAEKKGVVYRIRAGDKIAVNVFQEDLSLTPTVNGRGIVNLSLIQEIRVAGLTVNEAERAIENAYREGRFLRNPQVSINVEGYAPREVTIGGQVKAPGRYPVPPEVTMTLLELVSKAGGFTDTAKGTAVRVTRILPDGSTTNTVHDVESILRGRKDSRAEDSSLTLEADDIVYVPERII
jgi:polysaccharide export outer membrane protein